MGYFEKHHSFAKTAVATSRVTFGNIRATFYSNIWSHWLQVTWWVLPNQINWKLTHLISNNLKFLSCTILNSFIQWLIPSDEYQECIIHQIFVSRLNGFCLWPKAKRPGNYLSCSWHVVNLLLGCTYEVHFSGQLLRYISGVQFWFKSGRRPRTSPGFDSKANGSFKISPKFELSTSYFFFYFSMLNNFL